MQKTGRNLKDLRRLNQGQVLKNLLINGYASRQQLSSALGVTRMTISNIVNDLLDYDIVEESGHVSARGVGRKRTYIQLKNDSLFAIGIYISRSKVCCSIASITGELIEMKEKDLGPKTTRQSIFAIVKTQIRYFLNKYEDKPIIGIGVATVGLVNSNEGTVVSSRFFYDIADWKIGLELSASFTLPVYVLNDMKASALAEYYYGIGREMTSFVYLGITDGIGAGIVANGELFEGNSGFTSQIGHMSINKDGELCSCGNRGCLELYASVPNVLKSSNCAKWEDFLKLFEGKNIHPASEQFISDLGIGLTNIVNIFDIDAIVIGHEGALLNSYCLEKLQILINTGAIASNINKVRVLTSVIDKKMHYLSAIAVTTSRLFSGEIVIPWEKLQKGG